MLSEKLLSYSNQDKMYYIAGVLCSVKDGTFKGSESFRDEQIEKAQQLLFILVQEENVKGSRRSASL